MTPPKISIIGAGTLGSTLAMRIAESKLGNVILLDIIQDFPQGRALDLMQSGPIMGFDTQIKGTNNYEETANSDIIILTAGKPRDPSVKTRDDLAPINAPIISEVTKSVIKYSPDCTLIVVSNPLDVMTTVAYYASKLPPEKVMGMSGVLDSARFQYFIADHLKVSVRNVQAYVLGSHGDQMVPIPSCCSVAGHPLSKLIEKNDLQKIIERTKNGGGEIVKLLKHSSTQFAPTAAIFQMTKAIIHDKHQIMPVCTYANNVYGIQDTFIGLPAKIGRRGVEEIIKLQLEEEELKNLQQSAAHVKKICKKLPLK